MLELADNWDVDQPRDRTNSTAKATDGDVQEGAHDHGIELGAGAAGEFLSGPGGTVRPLVGTRRRHHLKGVSYRDDACAEGDLLAGQSVGIPGSIVLLVVLGNSEAPLAEPRAE